MTVPCTEWFTLGPVTLCWPSLLEKSAPPNTNQEPKYNTGFAIHDDVYNQQVWPVLESFLPTAFPNGEYQTIPTFKFPLVLCNTLVNGKGEPKFTPELSQGMYYGSAKTDYPLLDETTKNLVDASQQPLVDRSQIRSGAQAYISIRFYGYNKAGNIGVGIGLNAVMIAGMGQSIHGEGGVSVNEAFGGVQIDPSIAPAPQPVAAPQVAPQPVAAPQVAPQPVAAPQVAPQPATPTGFAPPPPVPGQ